MYIPITQVEAYTLIILKKAGGWEKNSDFDLKEYFDRVI